MLQNTIKKLRSVVVITIGMFSLPVYALNIDFSFTDDPSDNLFSRTHVAGTVTGTLFGLTENGNFQLPTSILFTSDLSFLGMSDNLIDANNSWFMWDGTGFNISNGVVIGGGFGLNFNDPTVGAIQFRLNGQGYNALHWNGGSSPVVGIGNMDGFGGASYAASSVPVPEPTSLALIGLGLAGLGFSRRKKAA